MKEPMAMRYDVCVIGGMGHVGLPLGISLAQEGKRVVLYDLDRDKLALVASGRMPFRDDGAEEALAEVNGRTLFLSSDREVIAASRFLVVTIGTPVDEHLNPKLTIFRRFFDELIDCISDDQHIILRSTPFPGTTERVRDYLAALGRSPRLSFCPERIAQGKAMHELRSLPQIISGYDDESVREAAELFSCLTEDLIRLTPLEAELAKLFTNVWRYIQFAISNQFLQIADENGADFNRIHAAITYRYPRAAHFAPAGFAAGPCLFKDTMQLAAFSNNNFFLGHAAMLVNEGMPNHIVRRLRKEYPLGQLTVGILGMAFKANSDDKRESLAYKLRKLLELEAAEVLCSDVYICEPGFVTTDELMRRADIVVIGAPHREYAALQPNRDQVVVDIWSFLDRGLAITL
jgi:UDP-N-acetyl-D-mannosaminuronic acid dehydrogenase